MLYNKMEDLLQKGAIIQTPLDQVRSGYYSTYFLVPKKESDHRPILNLKFFNLNVCNTSFKMEIPQSIIAVMHPHQWMASVDLKDAYFHIQVVTVHHQFQLQLAGQKLPIQNPSMYPIISPLSLHKDSDPSNSMAETPGNPAICLPQRLPDSRRV